LAWVRGWWSLMSYDKLQLLRTKNLDQWYSTCRSEPCRMVNMTRNVKLKKHFLDIIHRPAILLASMDVTMLIFLQTFPSFHTQLISTFCPFRFDTQHTARLIYATCDEYLTLVLDAACNTACTCSSRLTSYESFLLPLNWMNSSFTCRGFNNHVKYSLLSTYSTTTCFSSPLEFCSTRIM
jgi:hypothetical protein